MAPARRQSVTRTQPASGAEALAHDRGDLVGVGRAVDVDLEVVDLADRHVAPLAGDGAVVADGGDHRAALAGLAEVERVGVARVRVALGVARHVVVAEERVREAGRGQLGGVERGVGRLARLLPGEGGAFGGVRQRDAHPAAVDPEAGKEVVGVGRRAVRGSPQGQAVGELDGPQLGLA